MPEKQIDTSGADIGNQSTVERSTVDRSTVDRSTVDRSTVDRSTVDRSTVDAWCAESSLLYRSDPGQSRALAEKARVASLAIHYPHGVATSLHRLATLSRAEGDAEHGLAYGFQAEQIFEALGERTGVLRCKSNRAGFLKDTGRVAEAILLFMEVAYAFGLRQETANELSALLGLASCYEVAGDTSSYLETSLRVLDLSRAARLPLYESTALLAVAGSYADFNEWSRAIDHYEQAIVTFANTVDLQGLGTALANLGYACWRSGDVGRAISEYERVLTFSQEHGIRWIEIVASSCLGYLLVLETRDEDSAGRIAPATSSTNGRRNGKRNGHSIQKVDRTLRDRGQALAECAVGLAREGTIAGVFVDALVKLGEVYHLLGDSERAISHLREALDRSGEFALTQAHALEVLARIYGERNELERSNACLIDLAKLRERMLNEHNVHLLRSVEIKIESERAKKEREALLQQRDTLEKEGQEKERRLTMLALTLAERHELLDWIRTELVKHQQTHPGGPELPRSILRALEQHVEENDGWQAFEFEFSQLTGDFSAKLLARSGEFSPAEIRISALLRLGLGTKQIATLLKSSTRTIDWHRSSIRKKLGLESSANLNVYLQSL